MSRLLDAWYKGAPWLAPLWPLHCLARTITRRRRTRFLNTRNTLWQPPVPLIVVGNITLGGTGKTPLVQTLVKLLIAEGYRPGIISRGYGSKLEHYPAQVPADGDAAHYGDEPLLLAQTTGVPVVIAPERVKAAQYLLRETACDLIIADDGMQHYGLQRHLEIAVLDGARLLGNGRLLPAGPLREEVDRLSSVDFVIVNGAPSKALAVPYSVMALKPACWRNIKSDQRVAIEMAPFTDAAVAVVAGIGNPERVFATVRALGIEVEPYPFPDHHPYRAADFAALASRAVIMTAKDAVKCRPFAGEQFWSLDIEAVLPEEFTEALLSRIRQLSIELKG